MRTARHFLLLTLFLFSCAQIQAVEVKESGGYEIASKLTLSSKILGEERDILISLPKSYADSNATYPVLILLDGEQNIEHAVASSTMLSQWKGVPELITVAITSTNRVRDFTPTKDVNYSTESGGASVFQRFIESELMPYIDKTYRTHPYRVLSGHSLSGLFAADQLLLKNPFYSAYIIIGPSLWWENRAVFNRVDAFSERSGPSTVPVFFGIGAKDGDGMKQELLQFYNALNTQSSGAKHYAHTVFEDEGHMSSTFLSTYHGISHVFAGAQYDRALWQSFTSETFREFLNNTRQKYGSNVKQTGELYFELAQFLIAKSDFQGAITVLKSNLEAYPDYPPNFEWLANAYVLNDQPEFAIEIYQRAAQAALASSSFGSGADAQYLKEIERLQNPVMVKPQILLSHAGCYQSERGSMFKFDVKDKSLVGSRKGWTDFRLFALGDNNYYTRAQPKLELVFTDTRIEISAYGDVVHFDKVVCP